MDAAYDRKDIVEHSRLSDLVPIIEVTVCHDKMSIEHRNRRPLPGAVPALSTRQQSVTSPARQ